MGGIVGSLLGLAGLKEELALIFAVAENARRWNAAKAGDTVEFPRNAGKQPIRVNILGSRAELVHLDDDSFTLRKMARRKKGKQP
jgi:hypothetical protein